MSRQKGVRKFFSKPKKGYRTYGKLKNWRYSKAHVSDAVATHYEEEEVNVQNFDEKPRIRVLSLFDGIASGFYILSRTLNLDIESYCSSEIDKEALAVQRHHFTDEIIPIGDVTALSIEQLKDLSPVHVLLAGSPCNDFSRINHKRRGLYDPDGDGILFFEFVRIRDYFLQDSQQMSYKFYWLFENVVNMDNFTLSEINRYLQTEPIKMIPTTSSRSRYFWGNIPGQKEKNMTVRATIKPLQAYLKSYRVANMDILPVITTNSNTQYGKGNVAPVSEFSKPSVLYVTEFEALQGYPQHFTDVANLSVTKRWGLLARSWDINMVADILKPLRDLFRRKVL